MRWRQREAAERFAERRRREDEAPRLMTLVPTLQTLKFEIQEFRAGNSRAEAAHTRPIVVANAPALFFFLCQDPACKDGGHDVTVDVSNCLRSGKERFEGEDACGGQTGSADCGRVMRYTATATYSAPKK